MSSKVLLVEDTLTQALMIKHKLGEAGYSTTVARSGKDALALLQQSPDFDLILSDINMPEMDGYELCRQVKASERASHIPFILLVSMVDPREIVDVVECGADCLLLKDFDDDYFVEQLSCIAKTILCTRGGDSTVYVAGESYKVECADRRLLACLLSAHGVAVRSRSEMREPATSAR